MGRFGDNFFVLKQVQIVQDSSRSLGMLLATAELEFKSSKPVLAFACFGLLGRAVARLKMGLSLNKATKFKI